MIPGGYILQPRTFDGSAASDLPPVAREVFLYLVRNVNHSATKDFERGQGFFNIKTIMDALCWFVGYRKMTYSKTQVAKALRRLCEDSMIDTAKTTRGLLITVCNYGVYQNPKNYEDYSEGTAKELRRSSGGDTINKNGKNEKNDKKKTYGEFKNVLLTDSENDKLKDKFNGNYEEKIYTLSEYLARKGGKYKSHYLTILKWSKDDVVKSNLGDDRQIQKELALGK